MKSKQHGGDKKKNTHSNVIIQNLIENKEKNKMTLENMLNESNAKDRDLEILKRRVMIETNELNSVNNKIELLSKQKSDKADQEVFFNEI